MVHWLDELGNSGGLKQVHDFVQQRCPPVFLKTHAGAVHNGSMVLATDGTRTLGLTAGHVADAIGAHGVDADACQVGGAELRAEWLIARSKDLDLAAYSLSEATVRESRHAPFLVRSWPLPVPSEGDIVMVGGWPGCYRTNPEGRYDNAFVSVAAEVQSVSENNMGIVVDLVNGRSCTEERMQPGDEFGGMSGGPVFKLLPEPEPEGLSITLQLVGIVYTSGPLNILIAHTLKTLLPDGHFGPALLDNRK